MHLVWPSSHEWFEVCFIGSKARVCIFNKCINFFVFVLCSSTSMGTICALKVARLWLTASRATPPLQRCVVNIFVLAISIVCPKQNLRCSCTFCNPTCQKGFAELAVSATLQQPYPQCAWHWHGVIRRLLAVCDRIGYFVILIKCVLRDR